MLLQILKSFLEGERVCRDTLPLPQRVLSWQNLFLYSFPYPEVISIIISHPEAVVHI